MSYLISQDELLGRMPGKRLTKPPFRESGEPPDPILLALGIRVTGDARATWREAASDAAFDA